MENPESRLLSVQGWLTVKDAAKELGNVSTKLIYRLFHNGELEGATIAGTIRIRAASVAAYLDAHSNRKAEPAKPVQPLAEQPRVTRPPKKRRRNGQADPIRYRFFPP